MELIQREEEKKRRERSWMERDDSLGKKEKRKRRKRRQRWARGVTREKIRGGPRDRGMEQEWSNQYAFTRGGQHPVSMVTDAGACATRATPYRYRNLLIVRDESVRVRRGTYQSTSLRHYPRYSTCIHVSTLRFKPTADAIRIQFYFPA